MHGQESKLLTRTNPEPAIVKAPEKAATTRPLCQINSHHLLTAWPNLFRLRDRDIDSSIMADKPGKLIRSLKSEILELPPSCVEFCPAFPSYFLVGTYSLQQEPENAVPDDADAGSDSERDGLPVTPKQPQSRNGSIVIFRLADGDV